jgi:hypothetical protein
VTLRGWPSNLSDISDLLGVAPQRLFFYASNYHGYYQEIEIPKRSGNPRKIDIPVTELKGIQRLIAKKLWPSFTYSKISHGYRKGHSIVTAANMHLGPRSVLRIDMKDFFPSITANRIAKYFLKNGVSQSATTILTNLTTYKGRIPQGAPTSPGLSNAISYFMDCELENISSSWGLAVTRYSDDIIFSGKEFNWNKLLITIVDIVNRHGFEINESKTKYMKPDQGKRVLGLNVNGDVVRLPKKTRRIMRAAFYKAGNNPKWARNNLAKLQGFAEFYKMINGSDETYHSFRKTIRNIKEFILHVPEYME